MKEEGEKNLQKFHWRQGININLPPKREKRPWANLFPHCHNINQKNKKHKNVSACMCVCVCGVHVCVCVWDGMWTKCLFSPQHWCDFLLYLWSLLVCGESDRAFPCIECEHALSFGTPWNIKKLFAIAETSLANKPSHATWGKWGQDSHDWNVRVDILSQCCIAHGSLSCFAGVHLISFSLRVCG